MTKKEAAIVSAYTGYLIGDFDDFHAYVEEIMGRSVCTHELPALTDKIREKAKKDFTSIQIKEEPPEWLYHSQFEDRCCVDFDAVEKALGFKLFYWQKEYIELGFGYCDRRTGKTTAQILYHLLDVDEKPIDFSRPAPSKRIAIFRQDFRDIWEKLRDAGIEMRPVFWSVEDKKKWEMESINARIRRDDFRIEHTSYTCSDCSQCRYDSDDQIHYCRRTYHHVDTPEEVSTCDDFEKGE